MKIAGPRKLGSRFFAVASLGKGRWYWVVWPSLDELQATEEPLLHVAEGYEKSKAEAIDRALALAGSDAKWIAAKYARSYHRAHTGSTRATNSRRTVARGTPGVQEFLYRDIYGAGQDRYRSVPHRVVRRTPKSVFVEQRPYRPGDPTGSWPDEERATFRLDREELEREGYAFISVLEHVSDADQPVFFAKPRDERVSAYGRQLPEGLRLLGLSWPCTAADVRTAYRRLARSAHPDSGGTHEQFLALQEAYTQALWICR